MIAIALYEFVPKEPNQLPLREGCQVIVIGKEGDSKGWWRGKTMDRVSRQGDRRRRRDEFQIPTFISLSAQVGFFPKEYVREQPTTSDEQ